MYAGIPLYASWELGRNIYRKAFAAALLARSETPLGSCKRITRLICATLAAINPRELLAATSFNKT